MPGQTDETEAIMRWLAEEISPDTYVNVMGQYQPQFEVGQPGRDGQPRYASIDRRPSGEEMAAAFAAARTAGLHRLDARS
jgi:putative pyruvate formate lyase activating enzyme